MGALLTIDPSGSPTSQTLSAGLWDQAREYAEEWTRQLCAIGQAGRSSTLQVQPCERGTLTLRLTAAEVATFRTSILPGMLAGETLRVYPDSGDLLTYGDCVLESEDWVERYEELTGGSGSQLTLTVPIAYAVEGWL